MYLLCTNKLCFSDRYRYFNWLKLFEFDCIPPPSSPPSSKNVEIASLKECRKVKSLQMFRRPIQSACQGDRVGLCVTQFDSKDLERGLVAAPGYLPTVAAGVVALRRIPYFKGEIATRAKFHMSLGHETVLAK